MPRNFKPTTLAFSPERMREEMFRHARPAPDLLNKALEKLERKLEAKTTKFFTHQGEVIQQVDVEDHATQLSAADKILAISGAYARERDSKPSAPAVTLEVDPVTGVLRLVVGGEPPPSLPAPEDVSDSQESLVETQAALPAREVAGDDEDEPPQVIKVRKGGLPIDVHRALFGEDGK